jgi:hypothetical protein
MSDDLPRRTNPGRAPFDRPSGPRLVMCWPDGRVETVPLGPLTRVGRQRGENEVVVPETFNTVSGRHLAIRLVGGAYHLTDLGSSNGTRINGRPIAPNTPVALGPGDEIEIGLPAYGQMISMTFQPGEQAASATLVGPPPSAVRARPGRGDTRTGPPAGAKGAERPAKKPLIRRLGCVAVGVLAVLGVAGAAVLAFVLIGVRAYNTSPRLIGNITPPEVAIPSYTLSEAQQAVVSAHGYPDSFTILFYEDENGADARQETWTYSADRAAYTFHNGALDGEMELPAVGEVMAAPYRPEQFTAYMSLDQMLAATGIAEYMVWPLEDELIPGGESFFGDQITFGMLDGELLYVEAVAFATGEDAGETAEAPAEAPDAAAEPAEPTPAPEITPDDTPSQMDSFQDFVVEQGAGWLAGYWADPTGARAMDLNESTRSYADAVGVPGETPYEWMHAYMDARGYASVDDWLAEWQLATVEELAVLFEYPLTYVNFDDYGDLEFAARVTGYPYVRDLLAAKGADSIRALLDASGHDTAAAYAAATAGPIVDPAPTDWIAFASSRDDPDPAGCAETEAGCIYHIYLMNLESDEVRNVTSGESLVWASYPAWSPFRRLIAFTGYDGENVDIYVINYDGTGLRRVTTDPGADYHPSWSPDGSRLAFSSDRSGGGDIYTVDLTGGDLTQVTSGPAYDRMPHWAPWEDRIAFHSSINDPDPGGCWPDCNFEIYIIDADGMGLTRLTDTPAQEGGAQWSPLGGSIAFHSDATGRYQIYMMNDDGSDVRQLTDGPGNNYGAGWSYTGDAVYFGTDRNGQGDIYTIDVFGGGDAPLIEHPADDHWAR